MVQSYRAYDPTQTVNGYPRGQVEFAIYANDSASLGEWVTKHTGMLSGPSATPIIYWEATSNVQLAATASRNAIYFDATIGPSATLHTLAFVWKSAYIFRLDWWSSDPSLAPAIESTGRQMIDSFQG